MSAEAMKVSSVLDTSHLNVKFPFKSNMEITLMESLLSRYQENISIIQAQFQTR